MAVFDELNNGHRRLEDPEARKAEKISRKGEFTNIKRKSSGVTLKSYKRSIVAVQWGFAILAVAVIVYFGWIAISAFVGG